jgi:hypothetical protein
MIEKINFDREVNKVEENKEFRIIVESNVVCITEIK